MRSQIRIRSLKRYKWSFLAAGAAAALAVSNQKRDLAACDTKDHQVERNCGVVYHTGETIMNWSGTHSHKPGKLYEPKNAQEILRLLRFLHDNKLSARPIGTALSPNGISLYSNNAISLSSLDYIEVDPENMLVTVGAGARVSDVLNELKKFNLTLSNFSSITEQQIGGWTQVAAHGTGATLPTVEEMIVRMKLATPTEGLLTLDASHTPKLTDDLFSFAKAGLGCLGVVTEVTLQCIPALTLREETWVTTLPELRKRHAMLLRSYRHVRYMYLPHTDQVVVVVSNPVQSSQSTPETSSSTSTSTSTSISTSLPTQPLIDLVQKTHQASDPPLPHDLATLSFSQLRDLLIHAHPLDAAHIQQVNQAEAAFWQRAAGTRTADSREVLGFDCGGEQLVYEVCFPIGTLSQESYRDLDFVQKVLDRIKKLNIPAPCPIEQRWTAASTAKMSPAHSSQPDDVFSWVGIIMYLPPSSGDDADANSRREVERAMAGYIEAIQDIVVEYQAQVHWAKIELPRKDAYTFKGMNKGWWGGWGGDGASPADVLLKQRKEAIRKRCDVDGFNRYREALDPNKILVNELLEKLVIEK